MDNEKDPVRRNVRELARLRNDSTHFIVNEYEIIYGPILQANVENYASKLEELHNFSIAKILPKRSLILPVAGDPLDEEAIAEKYDEKTAEKLFKNYQRINQYVEEDESKVKFAHFYRVEVEIVKKTEKSNIKIAFDNNAATTGAVLNRTRDSGAVFPHRMTECLSILNDRLSKEGIELQSKEKSVEKFNRSHWDNFVKAYKIKEDRDMAYNRASAKEKNASYIYSQKAIDFIFELLKSDPIRALDTAREKVQERKK